jgi:hypothetical protein
MNSLTLEHDGGKELRVVLEIEWNAIQRHPIVETMTGRNGQYSNVT